MTTYAGLAVGSFAVDILDATGSSIYNHNFTNTGDVTQVGWEATPFIGSSALVAGRTDGQTNKIIEMWSYQVFELG